MELFLMILKYLGTGISGAAGIWGTTHETHDEKTGKLTRWGKWALGLAIGGFVVALSSQIAEQIRDDREQLVKEKEHLEQVAALKEQLALARGIASSVEGQRTHFDHIEVALIFELPLNDSKIGNLVDELTQLGAPYPQDARIRPLKDHPGWEVSRGPSTTSIHARPDSMKGAPGIGSLANCFAGLRSAAVSLAVNKQPVSSENDPFRSADLRAGIGAFTNRAVISYDSKSPPKLVFRLTGCDFDASSSDWKNNGKVIGIHDLSGAKLTLQVWWNLGPNKELSPLISPLRLTSAMVTFGKFPCRLQNFSASPIKLPAGSRSESILSTRYECALPDANAILSGQTRR